MSTVHYAPRHERTLKWFFDTTISNLGNCYMYLKPGASADEFVHGMLEIVAACDDPSVEEPIEIATLCVSDEDRERGKDWISCSPLSSLIVACAYCLRAGRAMHASDIDLAWSFMSDARYWAGVAISSKGINEARTLTIALTKRERGLPGAAARNNKYELVKQFACKMAKKKRPPAKGWQSKAQAAEAIKDLTLRFAKRKRVPLSKDQAFKTIYGWLGKMPEAATLFPKKENSKNKNRGGEPDQ
jgi:hypothetical protein